jgi:hypothetical protein
MQCSTGGSVSFPTLTTRLLGVPCSSSFMVSPSRCRNGASRTASARRPRVRRARHGGWWCAPPSSLTPGSGPASRASGAQQTWWMERRDARRSLVVRRLWFPPTHNLDETDIRVKGK